MRLIDADALKKEWSMGDVCETCVQDTRQCGNDYCFSRMDVCGMIDDAQTVSGWISVKDRLPEENVNQYTQDYQEVLCVLSTRFGTDVRVYKFGKGHFWNGPQEIDRMISHWMPFPELPKDGELGWQG